MLERFKNYETVVIDCESYEEIMFLREVLVKEGLKENILTSLKNCNVVCVYPKEKRFNCCTRIEIPVGNTDFHNFNHYITNFKSVSTLDMKKKMYFTKDQLRCIDYVEYELKWIKITDIYYDDFGLVVKGKCGDMEFEDAFDEFFQDHICGPIEDEFFQLMSCDWDELDYQYEMLKLSRKCMRELI